MQLIDVTLEDKDNWMTYEQAADDLGIPYTAFRQAVAKFSDSNAAFRPSGKLGRRTMFHRNQIDEMRAFMESRSFSLSPDQAEPSLDLAQLTERLQITKAGVWYYRRRYGKLFPSFYQRIGQARPQARFALRDVEAFEQWLAAGKPEDEETKIADVSCPPGADLMVTYKNGVTVALINDEEHRITPEMSEEAAMKYVERARMQLDTMRLKK